MKGDFSRLTFDPKKHYRRVLMQQGRVQVDADWNEQEAINQFRAEIEARDVIGRCGAPLHDAGFQITYVETFVSTAAAPFLDPERYVSSGDFF